MHRKPHILFVLSALLLTMCRSYSERELANPMDGLSCRSYTGYFEQGMGTSRGIECYYTCSDGTVGPLDFEGDPSLSATKGDLDRQFCSIAPQFTPTEPGATLPPTLMAASPTIQASATIATSSTVQPALLTGSAPMCDLGVNLINFRIVNAAPDLTGKTLDVQIQEHESACYVNPTNRSLLTCSIPDDIIFPARIVVSLDGAVVNDFVYGGIGCSILTTLTPAPAPEVSGSP